MRALACMVLLGSSCAVEPNGLWGKSDSGLAFVDLDGGQYWYPRDLFLRQISYEFYVDCSSLTKGSSRLEYSGRSAALLWTAPKDRPAIMFEMRDYFIDEGYRSNHRDAGTVGPVWLAFDAGVVFEGATQARFSWLATYLDDAGVVAREGGESVFEREEMACQ